MPVAWIPKNSAAAPRSRDPVSRRTPTTDHGDALEAFILEHECLRR
jgi:hypothetical protein